MTSHPLLYEINTRCWLRRLSDAEDRVVTLADVPEDEISSWEKLGLTHIWAMGVWTTGPRCRALALSSAKLRETFNKILPGWTKHDVPGSPYAIGNYEVPATLGGNEGLKKFRERLNARGMKLLLDFVPNHLGLDHAWATERPELFVQGPAKAPGTFRKDTRVGERWLAHGKDPHFAPWVDTVQINYCRADTRAAMIELLQGIARRCDGARCDMAMLMLNDVFAKTWSHFPETDPSPPTTEFWADAISAVKREQPGFIFLGEVYWGLEARLQSLGFDFTYDKTVYDRLLARDHGGLQKDLLKREPKQLAAGAHFLENHDEKRIASILSPAEHRAAAMLMLGLPGMRFLHEGQLQGAKIHVPVQLGRWPDEPVDAEISAMYEKLLGAVKDSAVGQGEWQLLTPQGWTDNSSAENIVVVQWQKEPQMFDLAVVNLAGQAGQCRVKLAVKDSAASDWEIFDALGVEKFTRHGGDLEGQGLHLELPPNGAQLLRIRKV